jgi:hypothetical protein
VYLSIGFAIGFAFLAFVLIDIGINRSSSESLCAAVGAPGQYLLSFGSWSCAPLWPAMLGHVALPALLIAPGIAGFHMLFRVANWRLGAQPTRPRTTALAYILRRGRDSILIGLYVTCTVTIAELCVGNDDPYDLYNVCLKTGGPGEYALNYGTWSCSPDWDRLFVSSVYLAGLVAVVAGIILMFFDVVCLMLKDER